MERHLLELRTFLGWENRLLEYISKFEDEPLRLITIEDYRHLFKEEQNEELYVAEGLVDIFQFQEAAKIKMLLLFSINVALYYHHTKEWLTYAILYERYKLDELILKFSVIDVLMNLYEIMASPALHRFLLITNVVDDLHTLVMYKAKNVFLKNYWEAIHDNFLVAAKIEEMELGVHCHAKDEGHIHYWLFYLITQDRCLSLNTIAPFITDPNFIRASTSYEKLKQLCINQMYGITKRSAFSSQSSTSAFTPVLPKRTRKQSLEEEEEEEEESNTERFIIPTGPPLPPCPLCQEKATCVVIGCQEVFGNVGFQVCRYNRKGFHGCKTHDNALNKESPNETEKQQLKVKVTDDLKEIFPNKEEVIMQGFRLDNKVVKVKNKTINTLGTLCVSDIPELHGITSVSIRVYLYDGKYFKLGVIENMSIESGDISDIKVLEESSVCSFSIKKNRYVEALLENNKKITFDFTHSIYMIVDDMETEYNKTSFRIFKAWKCDPPAAPFQQVVREDYFYIMIGTRASTKKFKALKLFY